MTGILGPLGDGVPAQLRIRFVRASDAGQPVAVFSTACGSVSSTPAILGIGSCEYDFNGDESVDLADAQAMAQVFVGLITSPPGCLDGDLNGDEQADLIDAQLPRDVRGVGRVSHL